MTFLDLALGYAARGWYVLPLKPRDKFPIIPKSEGGNGYKDATLDEQLIRQWWARWPDANIGIACGASNLFVSDCDHGLNNFGDFESWCIRNGLPITYTVHSGGRDGFRVQMYYSGAIPCGKKFELDGVCGEIRSGGFLVVAAGSIHPISGEKYEVLVDAPIALRPEIFEKSIVTLKTELADRKPGELITENRNMHAVSELGKLRARMHPTQEQALAFLLQWNSDTCAEPLPEEEIAELVHKNFRMYPDTPEPPGVTVGRTSIVATDKGAVEEVVEELDKSLAEPPAPEYPLSVWEGTLYLDFARRAQRGNFMPLEFLVEGAMTYTGAVLGERLRGPSEDITPRMYTVLIAGPGIGKGSSFKRIKRLYYSHRLFHNRKEDVIPPYASALVNASGSENGLNDALLKHSRVIQEFEEVDRLLEKTEIQGSGGSLMSVIRTCFDSTEPGITTCKGRPLVAELAYLSLMGATTPQLWRKCMEGRDSYGSGLGGRFNLVASTETRTEGFMADMVMEDLQDRLEAKFKTLDGQTLTIPIAPNAITLLREWWSDNSPGKPHYNRVNVISHRKALHLAWVRGEQVITREIMADALRLGDYLVAIRDAYAVVKGEDRSAINENRVLHVLKRIAPKGVRVTRMVDLLDGLMSRASVYRALESLVSVGAADKFTVRGEGRPYGVYRVCLS